jgi:hypothetical protein
MCPTLLAEIIMHLIGPHIVIGNVVPGSKQLECGRSDFDAPIAQFGADGAVAFSGALREVDGRLVLDSAADTAAVVCFGHVVFNQSIG